MSVMSRRIPEQIRVPDGRDAQMAHRSIDIRDQLDRAYLDSLVGTRGDAKDAWLNFRRIGEVRYGITRSARIAGHARLIAVKVDASGNVVKVKDSGVEAEEVAKIYGRWGGVRGLTERYYTLMSVPGQSFLSRVVERGNQDGYWFLSASELPHEGDPDTLAKRGEPKTWRTARRPGVDGSWSAFERKIAPEDFLGRVWTPDAEYVEDVNSPMQSIAPMCQQLFDLTESISGRLRQRFAMAGILLIPNEINDAGIQGTAPRDRLYHSDKVLNYLIHVMTTNVVNHAQGLAQIPILLKGPGQVLDKVRHEIMDAQIAETDLKLRAELIDRILTALNQQKQSVKGGEGTSHWGMWAVSDEERRITVQPDLDAMCHALTRLVLWPALAEKKRKPGDIMQWRVYYDLSAASVRSNMSEEARQLYDRGAVSLAFLRAASGAGDGDMIEPEEYIRWVGVQTQNPVLMCYGLEGVEAVLEKAAIWGQKTGPSPDSTGTPAQSGPGVGDPGSPNDRKSNTPKSKEPG